MIGSEIQFILAAAAVVSAALGWIIFSSLWRELTVKVTTPRMLTMGMIDEWNEFRERRSAWIPKIIHLRLDDAQMANIDLSRAILKKVSFRASDLSWAELNGAKIEDADFSSCILSRVQYDSDTEITRANFSRAVMDRTFWEFLSSLPAINRVGGLDSIIVNGVRNPGARFDASVIRSELRSRARSFNDLDTEEIELLLADLAMRDGYRLDRAMAGAGPRKPSTYAVYLEAQTLEKQRAYPRGIQIQFIRTSDSRVLKLAKVKKTVDSIIGRSLDRKLVIMTNGEFSKDAKAWARRNNVRTIDGPSLARTIDSEQPLISFARPFSSAD